MIDCTKCKILFPQELYRCLIDFDQSNVPYYITEALLASVSNLLIFISLQGPPGPPGLQGPVGAPGIAVSFPLCSANLKPLLFSDQIDHELSHNQSISCGNRFVCRLNIESSLNYLIQVAKLIFISKEHCDFIGRQLITSWEVLNLQEILNIIFPCYIALTSLGKNEKSQNQSYSIIK